MMKCSTPCLSLLMLLLSSTTAKNCTIHCLHDTICVQGEANFSWHPVRDDNGEAFDFHKEIERDGYHCGCPPGLTGLRCGRHYESCNDGEHVCYNGGQCIAKMKDIYQNDQQYCDCPSTVDENGITKRYSGKYCEVEVQTSGNRCDADQNPCQNGGTCKETVDELDPCECKEGYVGRMCEFFEPSVPKCSLKCQHGGTCRYGTKEEDHSLVVNEPNGHQETQDVHVVHENYMYCECPHGYSGVHCETEEVLCGNSIKCRHGSTCVAVDNKDTGETTHHCDCAEVNRQKLEAGQDVQFAGRHCEIRSTSVCHYDDDPKASTFCAHDGTCPEEWHEHCSCKSGFHGAHCQFRTEDLLPSAPQQQQQHATCKLQCKNGGHCRKGTIQDAHVQDLVAKYGSELGSVGLNMTYNKDFEHCACPTGFVGIECEYSMTSCGENGEDHPCFHGSTCTMVDNVPTCVCSEADTHAAGIYCQHLANDICEVIPPSGKPQENGNKGFCVNGGVCVTNKDNEAACRCHSQFEGPHCEFTKAASTLAQSIQENEDAREAGSSGMSGGGKFGVVVLVFACVGAIGYGAWIYYKKDKKEDLPPVYPDLDTNLALDDHSLRACPIVDVGPEKDFDGNELKNVELL